MIGLFAGTLTTLAFVPQVIKVLKSKDTSAISLEMYCIQIIGILLWIIHGIMIRDTAILMANGATACLSLTILLCKIKYK